MRAERRARVQAEVDAEVNEVLATATTGDELEEGLRAAFSHPGLDRDVDDLQVQRARHLVLSRRRRG